MRKETMIKTDQPQELTKLTWWKKKWEFTYDLHFLLQWADTTAIDLMAEEMEWRGSELTFRPVDEDTIMAKPLENGPEMLLVLF